MNRFMLIQILVILLSPWWWIIIQRDFWVGLLIFILSALLFIFFWQNRPRKLFLILLILTTVIFFISIKEAFDESIFRNSALDIQRYNRRHEFLANGFGKIYKNRFSLTYFKNFSLPLSKLQQNIFSNLDPNLYFFSSHPRERLGVDEFKKYSPMFLPFFLIGVFYSIYILFPKLLIYTVFVLMLGSIISPKYNLGPILFFPLINFMITVGIILSIKKILKYLEKKA